MEITLSWVELVSLFLILTLFFLGFKVLEMRWSYRISKPYQWEQKVNQKSVSSEVEKLEKATRDKVRFYTFWYQIERLKDEKIPGCFAELGVYDGKTAKMIHEMDPNRELLLFDTFEGFHQNDLAVEVQSDDRFKESNFSDTSLEQVKDFVGRKENIFYYPGLFPESALDIDVRQFSLVHLDADLYQPTLEGLRYFYPKISPGGILIVHDYNHNWDGVKLAVDEFVVTIPETLTPIPDWQGSVIITKSDC